MFVLTAVLLAAALAAPGSVLAANKYEKPSTYSGKTQSSQKLSKSKSAFEQPVAQPAAGINEEQAYRETLEWAFGKLNDSDYKELKVRIERASDKQQVIFEFALAIVAAEAYYGKRVKGAPMSWARLQAWHDYDKACSQIGQQPMARYPDVINDLDNALSELRLILDRSQTFEEVYTQYWSGPDHSFNTATYADFSLAVGKLYNGLKSVSEERKRRENPDKYKSDYYKDTPSNWEEGGWAGLAYGDMKGYASRLGAMPKLASQLREFPGYEEEYARTAKRFNKKLTDAEATVIARAVLSYCADTDWSVDPRLVMALVAAESAFKPRAVSRVGAMGLGQLMPATARGHGIKDAFDPVQNLYATVKYLERELYRWRKSGNRVDLVLAAYNAGPGAVQKYKGVPPYKETKNYIRTVKKYYNDFKTTD
ncbi:lytic transglycosylase domain-containing protein [bacterium]|nr:lytic transglycosylase domain-containing protein [bacterium]